MVVTVPQKVRIPTVKKIKEKESLSKMYGTFAVVQRYVFHRVSFLNYTELPAPSSYSYDQILYKCVCVCVCVCVCIGVRVSLMK